MCGMRELWYVLVYPSLVIGAPMTSSVAKMYKECVVARLYPTTLELLSKINSSLQSIVVHPRCITHLSYSFWPQPLQPLLR